MFWGSIKITQRLISIKIPHFFFVCSSSFILINFKSLFSSNKDAQGNKQPSKFGSWFSKNSETIGNVGGSLLGGLFGSKGSDNANQQSEYYAGQNQPATQGQGNRSGMGKKILIGVAGLGVIGLIIYLVRKK